VINATADRYHFISSMHLFSHCYAVTISEGIKNFCRRESLEIIREKWLERRPYLVEVSIV